MVTKEQAIAAHTHGTEFHFGPCKIFVGPRGGRKVKIETWRTNGACKTWKTRPDEFSLPIKYGFNGPYHYITNRNASEFHLANDCTPTEVNVKPEVAQ